MSIKTDVLENKPAQKNDLQTNWSPCHLYQLFMQSTEEENRIIEMAWEDRTPFEAIKAQFGISEPQVIKLMRKSLKRRSFNLWRARVNSGTSQKHLKKRSSEIDRFKCSRQRQITGNKISKR